MILYDPAQFQQTLPWAAVKAIREFVFPALYLLFGRVPVFKKGGGLDICVLAADMLPADMLPDGRKQLLMAE